MRMEQTGDLIVLHDAGRGRLTGGVVAVLGAISALSASSRTASTWCSSTTTPSSWPSSVPAARASAVSA